MPSLTGPIARFFSCRPALRDAVAWSIPALLVCGAVRLILLAHLPYAFYGTDSYSYWAFPSTVYFDGEFDFPEKRRWLYPVLLLPTFYLPGAPLGWVALAQRAVGLLSIVPIAYAIRKDLAAWRLWVIPATCLIGLYCMNLEDEQQTGTGSLRYAATCWMLGAWSSWADAQRRGGRSLGPHWWSFTGAAIGCLLLKPIGRLLIPGFALGCLWSGLWRRMRWIHAIPFALAVPLVMTMGTDRQLNCHLLVTAFPILQMQSPRHAELKSEVADLVADARANLHRYYVADGGDQKTLVQNPSDQDSRPTWRALEGDKALMNRAFRDMALEAFLAHPSTWLHIAYQRVVFLLQSVADSKFLGTGETDPLRLRDQYMETRAKENRFRTLCRVFGHGSSPPPPLEELEHKGLGGLQSHAIRTMGPWLARLSSTLRFARIDDRREDRFAWSPTIAGALLAAGFLLSLTHRYRDALAPWALAAFGNLAAVSLLVSSIPPRQAVSLVPILILLCLLPLDAAARWLAHLTPNRARGRGRISH